MLRNTKFFGWKSVGALTVALLFGMMAVGCGTDDNPSSDSGKSGEGTDTPGTSIPSGLVGTWATEYGDTITISGNGTFEWIDYGRPF